MAHVGTTTELARSLIDTERFVMRGNYTRKICRRLTEEQVNKVSALQADVDAFLLAHQQEILSWEGELTEEMYLAGDLSDWLPPYNHGVYIVGEYACDRGGCDGCATTPAGFRTCVPRVKIGRASNMYNRLANLRCSSSRGLEVLALMPFQAVRAVEREVHRLFDGLRIIQDRRSEWFWNCPELEDLVNEVSSFAEYEGS